MMTEFTEGPWDIDMNGNIWAEDTKICEMSSMPNQASIYRSKPFSEHEANRHLIATSPELYAELHKIVTAESTDEIYAQLKSARLVLAKARGEK